MSCGTRTYSRNLPQHHQPCYRGTDPATGTRVRSVQANPDREGGGGLGKSTPSLAVGVRQASITALLLVLLFLFLLVLLLLLLRLGRGLLHDDLPGQLGAVGVQHHGVFARRKVERD